MVIYLFMKKITILLYHSPQLSVFEKHVEYLITKYNFITLDQAVTAMRNRDFSDLPIRPCVITFDDGHASNYSLLDTFKKYHIVPTIYICLVIVNTNRKFWWSDTISSKELLYLKQIPNKSRESYLNYTYKFDKSQEYPNEQKQALSLEQIKEMKPFVHFENHTAFHPILTTMQKDEFHSEMAFSIEKAREFGINTEHFSFPNGDYSEDIIHELLKYNFKSMRTTDIGWNDINTNINKLKIIGISDNASILKLKFQLTGVFGWLLNFIFYKNIYGRKKFKPRN